MDDGSFEDGLPANLSEIADALARDRAVADSPVLDRVRRRVLASGPKGRHRRSPRKAVAVALSLVFAVNAGGAIAAAAAGSGFTGPLKLVANEFGSLLSPTSTKLSAAVAVYCSTCTTTTTSVKATSTTKKKPKKHKKHKKKHKKKVKAVHVHRPPSFTG